MPESTKGYTELSIIRHALLPSPVSLAPGPVKHYFTSMVKVISKIGNSQGLIMDQALLELLHLRVGDQVNIEVHEGGTATLTPLRATPDPVLISATIASVVKDYSRTLSRLA